MNYKREGSLQTQARPTVAERKHQNLTLRIDPTMAEYITIMLINNKTSG